MLRPSWPWGKSLTAALALAFGAAACENYLDLVVHPLGGTGGNGGATTSSGTDGTGGALFMSTASTSSGAGGVNTTGLVVVPVPLQTVTVTAGQPLPTVAYTATFDGQPVGAAWGLDKGNVGTLAPIPGPMPTFTPTGTTGGLVTILASANGKTVSRQVMVKLSSTQNGPNGSTGEQGQIPTGVGSLTNGGGVGGVGGEGLGGPVTTPGTLTALGNPTGNGQAQGLKLLYPYDKTVWPRGILAPLLMWDWSTGDADAIEIQLHTTTGSFSWTGTFGRPAILAQTGGKFIRMPIPQDVWQMATDTAGGTSDQLIMSLTVAKGGVAYGPVTQTWTVAAGLLDGIIYYNSYGTQLAYNYMGGLGGNGQYGGAVLSIHVGDTGPKLVAGGNGDDTKCRVCHSVAANGSSLVVQHGDDYSASSAYVLTPTSSTEHPLANSSPRFPGVYPDGTLALDENAEILPLPADPSVIAPTGLVAFDLGTPAFSPDGTLAVFNPQGSDTIANIAQTLYVMSFARGTSTFSNPVVVDSENGAPADTQPGWPAFFPDSKSVVFHHQTVASVDGADVDTVATRAGARAQIWWTNVKDAQHVTPLDQLNGKGYLPSLPATTPAMDCDADGNQVGTITPDHSDDVNMNYEPTVNPVASGGYAWVVFTSRRMYGSVATIPPFCSDPSGVDLIDNITPKKLWVAAVDLTAAPGTDASHPAFYLPGQELLAGNSRGFWVLDPCRADGSSCTAGDQCCDGYCEPNGTTDGGATGALVCSNTPPTSMCSAVGEKCGTAASCCDMTNLCVNGFCAQMSTIN